MKPIIAAGLAVLALAANAAAARTTQFELPPHPRLLLNRDGVEELKARVERHSWAKECWESVKKRADEALEREVELPPRGGNWRGWYACPTHGGSLRRGKQIEKWKWEHICAIGGEALLGDPSKTTTDFDGCGIVYVHEDWSNLVRNLGLAYQITRETRYARKAVEIALAYAERYKDYPLHNLHGLAHVGGGRVGSSTLDESIWLMSICQGLDLIWETLTEEERTKIETQLLQPAARDVILPYKLGVHNIQCWKNTAVGLIGLLVGDKELIYEAFDNPDSGYHTQINKGVLSDGSWFEGAWGYHSFALNALLNLTEAARNSGTDLYGKKLKAMFDVMLKLATPTLKLPAFNDSQEHDLRKLAVLYELGYARYRDPDYARLLSEYNRKSDQALWFGMDVASECEFRARSTNSSACGYAVLARGDGKDATWLCLKYGPHGGGHGHPDKLNFVIYARGEAVAIDPGFASYGLPVHAEWYRTTLAHNTLVVDEASQKSAEGRCIAFGSEKGVDYVSADAGEIYDGVRFVRTAALLDQNLLAFIDLVSTDEPRTLDIAYHQRGTWIDLPPGLDWELPDKLGYKHLRDATSRPTRRALSLKTRIDEGWDMLIALAGGEQTEVITGTGIWRHLEDHVPAVIFRRTTNRTAYGWAVSLDGSPVKIEHLPLRFNNGAGLASAVRVTLTDGRSWVLISNPDKRSVSVELSNGSRWETQAAVAVQ